MHNAQRATVESTHLKNEKPKVKDEKKTRPGQAGRNNKGVENGGVYKHQHERKLSKESIESNEA